MEFPGTPSLSSSAVEATSKPKRESMALPLLSGRGSLSSREGSVSQASLTNDWSLLPSSFLRQRRKGCQKKSSPLSTQFSSFILLRIFHFRVMLAPLHSLIPSTGEEVQSIGEVETSVQGRLFGALLLFGSFTLVHHFFATLLINLLSLYRSTFKTCLRQEGLERLIRERRKKNSIPNRSSRGSRPNRLSTSSTYSTRLARALLLQFALLRSSLIGREKAFALGILSQQHSCFKRRIGKPLL